MDISNDSLPRGFQWSAVTAGIKASGKPDLALAICPGAASAAAMFTSNQVVAAPVTVGLQHLASNGGRVWAVLVNAGNANCATGEHGIAACERTCMAVAETFGCDSNEIFPCSTGIIGVPLPTDKIVEAVPAAKAALGATAHDAEAFAAAILTTDTRIKVAYASFEAEDGTVRLFGCAKGAGMIGPQLVSTTDMHAIERPSPAPHAAGSHAAGAHAAGAHATMLVYLFTDIEASSAELEGMLRPAVAGSFNAISVDGDMSTNDTVLLLSSGRSGVALQQMVRVAFASALAAVCASLAHQIVADGEGVTHVVRLMVSGAQTDSDAAQVARTIANSPLCKTAWSSADPNWGRLLAAAGRAGIPFDPAEVTIRIAGLPIFEGGQRAAMFDEAATHAAMSSREYTIAFDLGQLSADGSPAKGRAHFITCDLTHEYVSINADYST